MNRRDEAGQVTVLIIGFAAILMLVVIERASIYDQGTLAIIFCLGIGPLLAMTVLLYLYARGREDRQTRLDDND